jgi:sec-independent protein translocase protein TatA
MPFGLGTPELVILLVIVLILFGGAKLPQLAKGLGEGMKEFRKATRDDDEEAKTDKKSVAS